MEKENQREEKRFDTIHLLNYICLDKENRQLGQGMARTLNLSETGVKIETHQPIETWDIVFLAIGIGEDIFDIKGKVVYCNQGPEGRFESGVEFYELDFESFGKLKRFIKVLEEYKG